MRETTKKLVRKAVLAILVSAAAAVGLVCWLGGLFTRRQGKDSSPRQSVMRRPETRAVTKPQWDVSIGRSSRRKGEPGAMERRSPRLPAPVHRLRTARRRVISEVGRGPARRT